MRGIVLVEQIEKDPISLHVVEMDDDPGQELHDLLLVPDEIYMLYDNLRIAGVKCRLDDRPGMGGTPVAEAWMGDDPSAAYDLYLVIEE
jgi:hypothetical protein